MNHLRDVTAHWLASFRLGSYVAWIAALSSCTGADGTLRSSHAKDRGSTLAEEGRQAAQATNLQVASGTITPPKEVPSGTESPKAPPLAMAPARPLEVIREKPDVLVEDACVSCGGAVWRVLLRNVSAHVQMQRDKLLLFEKPDGGPPRVLLAQLNTGEILWTRTLKSTNTSSALHLRSVHFLEQGTIALLIEENRGGQANGKLVLLGADGSKITELDFDRSLVNLTSKPAGSGLLVYGELYSHSTNPADRFYMALHDAKGQPLGAFLDEMGQIAGIVRRPHDILLISIPKRSKKSTRIVEVDAKNAQVVTKKDYQVDWILPFVVESSLYFGVLEAPGNKEWSIRRIDGDREKQITRSRRSLSEELGNAQFWVEYGGRDRRYFPLFSSSEEPTHILRAPENAVVYLGPGGDAITMYEGILARWPAEKGPSGSTIASMKLLTR